jgi:cytochrome c oxidase subunit 2
MAFAPLLWLVTLATAAAFFVRRWWLPQPINLHGLHFDSWFSLNLAVAGIIFLAAQLGLAWFVWRHRDRGQQASPSHGSTRLETWWTALTTVLFLATALAGSTLWTTSGPSTDAPILRIETVAKQFAWSFRYPGPDQRYGRTELRLVNDAAGNPFGIDDRDPAGRDDITSSALRVPAGRPVELALRSQDVIHNFFVRELRIKQDLVPGMNIPFRFQADTPGEYEIACSELCGLGHHQMRSVLIVLPPAQFESWLATQTAAR